MGLTLNDLVPIFLDVGGSDPALQDALFRVTKAAANDVPLSAFGTAQNLDPYSITTVETRRAINTMVFDNADAADIATLYQEISAMMKRERSRLIVSLSGIVAANNPTTIASAVDMTEDELREMVAGLGQAGPENDLTPGRMQAILNIIVRTNSGLSHTVSRQYLRYWILEAVTKRLFVEHTRYRREHERREEAAGVSPVRAQITVAPATPDFDGHDSKPDPLEATTEAEFVDAMRRYRVWAGNLSLREMASLCRNEISHATFGNMLASTKVPRKLSQVDTFVVVLGGTAADRQRWATAWRQFRVPAPACKEQLGESGSPPRLRLAGS